MKHTTISNDPANRARITHAWAYWDNAFTGEELQMIIDFCDGAGTEKGATFRDQTGNVQNDRSSNVKFHYRNKDTAWIFDRCNTVIQSINEMYYGYDLNGYGMFQYTTYTAEEGGKYDWHMDMSLDHMPDNMIENRKLSMTLPLNDDFEGGEFQINNGRESDALTPESKKGRALIFPSYMIHRVKPVTKGVRKSLVIWVVGPKFI